MNSKLTLDLGVRYDFFPTLTEVHNAGSFFSPTTTNPVTGQPGALQFTGNGPGTCNCSTPVNNYFKNIGPRIGLAYTARSQRRSCAPAMASCSPTATRSAAPPPASARMGFSASAKYSSTNDKNPLFTGSNEALPAYQPACGVGTGAQYGTGYVTTAPILTTCGQTLTATSFSGAPAATLGYPDPYLGSRAPEYINYTFGIQHQWTNAFTSTMTYVGSQGHFLPADGSNARGYWADQLDPKYLYLGTHLADQNAAALADCATYSLPCPANFNFASTSLATALHPFPQESVSDSFGYVANSNYHSLQASLNMRPSHGMTFMANYTWSKAIDDGGTFRTGYAIPAQYSPTGKAIQQDRIDRSLSTTDQPQHLVVTGVFDLPFGKSILNGNFVERAILGGFKFSEIFQAFSGSPLGHYLHHLPHQPGADHLHAVPEPLLHRPGAREWQVGCGCGRPACRGNRDLLHRGERRDDGGSYRTVHCAFAYHLGWHCTRSGLHLLERGAYRSVRPLRTGQLPA